MVAKKGKTKTKAAGAKKPAAKKTKGDTSNQLGHNVRITISKKSAKDYAARYNRLMDEKEAQMDVFKADTDTLIQEAAAILGCSKKIARQGLKEQRAEAKREEREREMEPGELADLDKLRDALGLFGDTELGKAAVVAAGGPAVPAPAEGA